MTTRWIVLNPPVEHAGGHLATWPVPNTDPDLLVDQLGNDVFRHATPDDERLDITDLANSSGRTVTPEEIMLALAHSGFSCEPRPSTLNQVEQSARGDVRCWLQYAAWHGGFQAV